jgi:hypothetical protein
MAKNGYNRYNTFVQIMSINKWKSSSISLKNNNNTLKKLENIINESPGQYHIMLKSFKNAF